MATKKKTKKKRAADQRLITVIQTEIGYREKASGWTKFAQWYEDTKPAAGFSEAPWCQILISWAADRAGIPDTVIPRMAYTPFAARWFKDRGLWGRVPRVGALVYFDWGGSHSIDAIDHVGVVTAVLADGRIRTLEGNTANQLQERTRSLVGVSGFAYPNYAAAARTWMEDIVDDLPLLKTGSTGTAVKRVFYLLMSHGYPLDPKALDDTVLGPPVVAVVKAFQKAEGLAVDGQVGKKTWTRLIAV